jgi:hypothetical protein
MVDGRKLRAAPSDPPKNVSQNLANQEKSIFAAKGKVYLYLNNLPFDVQEAKILKCIGL